MQCLEQCLALSKSCKSVGVGDTNILPQRMLRHLCQGKATDHTADKLGSSKQPQSLGKPHSFTLCPQLSQPLKTKAKKCAFSAGARLFPSSGKCPCREESWALSSPHPQAKASFPGPGPEALTSQSFQLPLCSGCCCIHRHHQAGEPLMFGWENCQEESAQQ